MATLLKGIAVFLGTADRSDAGTDDHLYVGIVGRGGGREFALATQKEDFEPQPGGQGELFLLGSIWDGTVFSLPNAKTSDHAEPGGDNDPARFPLDLDLVDYVYLRKQGDNSHDDDDAYALHAVRVILFGPVSPFRRDFGLIVRPEPSLWLGNEFGHVVYLPETTSPDPTGGGMGTAG